MRPRRSPRLLWAWVRLLLRAFPPELRRRHGPEIEQLTVDGARDAPAVYWLGASFDLLRSGLRARRARRAGLHTPALPLHPRSAISGGGEPLSNLLHDLRGARRALHATPLTAAVIVVTLAVAIGMNVAIFSAVDAVVLRPLEYPQADRLVVIDSRLPTRDPERRFLAAGGMLERLRSGVEGLSRVEGMARINQNLTGTEAPQQVQVGWVSPGAVSMLGVEPALGRNFEPDDPSGLIMLGWSLWHDSFGADPAVIGRGVELDGVPYTIVGVAPADFQLHLWPSPRRIDLWKLPDDQWANGDVWNALDPDSGLLNLFGQLAPGSSLGRVQAEVDALVAAIRDEHSSYEEAQLQMEVVPLKERVVSTSRPMLLGLMGAGGIVLLIACANVMNLMLVRAGSRAHEVALRLALGARRGRIVRLLMLECGLLAVAGGLLGVLLAAAGVGTVARLAPLELPRLSGATLDLRVLAFSALVMLTTPFLFGLLPALRGSRRDLARAIGDGRSSHDEPARGVGRLLVVAQISLSLMLLIGAGLLTSSLLRLQKVDTGLSANDALTFSISLPGTRYEWPEGTGRFFDDYERELERLPGVRAAGVVWPLPLSGSTWSGNWGGGEHTEGGRGQLTRYVLASGGSFDAMGAPIRDGRTFESTDPRHVVIVSAGVASRGWPGRSPIGSTLTADPWGRGPEEFEIVGVVGDIRYDGLREPPSEAIYFDARSWSWVDWEVDVVVRTDGEPTDLVAPARELLAVADAEIPMAQVGTLRTYVDGGLAPSRFALGLVGAFAGVAGLLALIGLYGVLSFTVSTRRRELGIRLALGSDPGGLLRLIVGQGMRLALIGLAVGVGASLAATRLIGSFLYEVSPTDPRTFSMVSVALLLVATIAAWFPARRATRLDPARVLREE